MSFRIELNNEFVAVGVGVEDKEFVDDNDADGDVASLLLLTISFVTLLVFVLLSFVGSNNDNATWLEWLNCKLIVELVDFTLFGDGNICPSNIGDKLCIDELFTYCCWDDTVVVVVGGVVNNDEVADDDDEDVVGWLLFKEDWFWFIFKFVIAINKIK